MAESKSLRIAYGEALALIAPEDYFASNPNFRFFEQLPNPYPG